jgi:hypothetical protein
MNSVTVTDGYKNTQLCNSFICGRERIAKLVVFETNQILYSAKHFLELGANPTTLLTPLDGLQFKSKKTIIACKTLGDIVLIF